MDYDKGGRHRFRKLASLDTGSRQYSEVTVEVELELYIALLNFKKAQSVAKVLETLYRILA